VFSERASPVQWMGPARFHAPPISIDELPPIAGVILSHNHYDHLDHAAVMQLAGKTARFIAPLGVGDQLIAWGVDASKVEQLDWWQSTEANGLRLTATPGQHFSGRGLGDSDRSLWASWVIQDGDFRIFFSGDTGYFDGFKAIGEKYGPFDLTMIETGAYDPRWAFVHMQPEQTLQAHLDLRGKWLLPIHNGTFDLALHAWQQPFERITALAAAKNVPVATPMMGEALDMQAPQAGTRWWETVEL
jgi:L-ascorbate metabolism protein UlaG (beta-lactamase superfamily)